MMAEIQPLIDSHIATMNLGELTYVIDNYSEYLRIDLRRDFVKQQQNATADSAADFNSLFDTGTK